MLVSASLRTLRGAPAFGAPLGAGNVGLLFLCQQVMALSEGRMEQYERYFASNGSRAGRADPDPDISEAAKEKRHGKGPDCERNH